MEKLRKKISRLEALEASLERLDDAVNAMEERGKDGRSLEVSSSFSVKNKNGGSCDLYQKDLLASPSDVMALIVSRKKQIENEIGEIKPILDMAILAFKGNEKP